MTKLLNILFFVFCIGGQAQNYNPVSELQYPSLIPNNTSFDISLISDNSILEAEALNLYIISKNDIDINSIKILTTKGSFQTSVLNSVIEAISDNVYLAEIKLQREELPIQSFFQVLMNYSSGNSENIKIKFYGEFIRDQKVIAVIGNLEENNSKDNNSLIAEIKTYKPDKTTRNAAKFESGSNLEIELKNNIGNRLWIGFWLKVLGSDLDIFKLINKKTGESLVRLCLNDFQKLCLLDKNGEIINSSAPFLSKKIWNHIGFEMNLSEQIIYFYSDRILFAKHYLSDILPLNEIIISFGNNSSQSFTIEQLRILKPNNGASKIIEDTKYILLSPKVAEPVLQLNFDTLNELTNPKNIQSLKYQGIKFITSNAPIFSRAPELNINILSTYMQLEWISPDSKNSTSFIVEKSSEERGFIEIGTIAATSENSSVYSYIDAADAENKILYYRIKQINKDGSVVYSSQVKVGVGNIEQFKLNQNYPNPFNPLTSIELDLFEDSEIEIIIYNIEGQELAVLQKGFLTKGIHKFDFDASNLPSGVYLYKVSTPVFSQTKKMLLTK